MRGCNGNDVTLIASADSVSVNRVELRISDDAGNAVFLGSWITSCPATHHIALGHHLSNKLTALYRYEAKDVADIVEICCHESFSWPDMMERAAAKEASIDPSSVAEILASAPPVELSQPKWVEQGA